MERRTAQDIRNGFPPSADMYLNSLTVELEESLGAVYFRVHRPAPEDMTREQLEVVAADLRAIGWLAEVAPLQTQKEQEDGAIGIRVEASSKETDRLTELDLVRGDLRSADILTELQRLTKEGPAKVEERLREIEDLGIQSIYRAALDQALAEESTDTQL